MTMFADDTIIMDLAEKPRQPKAWLLTSIIAMAVLIVVVALNMAFYASTKGQAVKALGTTYVSGTSFIYRVEPDKIVATGTVDDVTGETPPTTAYELTYMGANYETSDAIAQAFERDKERLRAGKLTAVTGELRVGDTNRQLTPFEEVSYYGMMPGLFFSGLSIVMGAMMLLGMVAIIRNGDWRGATILGFMACGLAAPSIAYESMYELAEPYVLVEKTTIGVKR